MSYQSVRAALDARLQEMAAAASLTVKWENVEHLPVDGVEFLSTALLTAQPQPASVGVDGYDRISGIYQINVHVHRDTGSGRAMALADSLAAQFSRGGQLTHSGLTVTLERAWPGPALFAGDFFVVPVSVAWFAFV